jgi:4-carboxymuconolactone decarboxylase
VLAREWNSDIEWTAHAALAAKAGVSAESIEAVRTRKPLSALPEPQQVIAKFVLELLREKKLSDDTFRPHAHVRLLHRHQHGADRAEA